MWGVQNMNIHKIVILLLSSLKDEYMDALISRLAFEGSVVVPSADKTTIWPHKN
jgi:hypothetical protein